MHFSRARLRGHRDGQRRSQRAVAEAACLSTVDYELIELGVLRPTESQEQALADALHLDLAELCSPQETADYWSDYADTVMSYAPPLSDADVEAVAQLLARSVIS